MIALNCLRRSVSMDSNKLPIVDPPITGRLHTAFPLAIILNHDKCWDWFYSRYIQMMSNTEHMKVERYLGLLDLDFATDYLWWRNCWLDGEVTRVKKLVNKFGLDLHEFIMDSVDEGYYLYTLLNEFYVPDRYYYGKKKYDHDNFIYGYNRHDKTYNVVAYNDREKYTKTVVKFDDFYKGFMETGRDQWFVLAKMGKKQNYDLNIKLIYKAMREYIDSTPPLDFALDNYKFGLDIYDCLKQYLVGWNGDYDIRPLHSMWEHKTCMTMRIDYLCKNNYLSHIDRYYDKGLSLEKKLLGQRNNLLKCNLSGRRVSNKMLNTLDDIRVKDYDYMSLIAEDLYTTNKGLLDL